jgi:hypothetical protein
VEDHKHAWAIKRVMLRGEGGTERGKSVESKMY